MTANTSLVSGELWAPSTSRLKAVPEPALEIGTIGTLSLMALLAATYEGSRIASEAPCAPSWSGSTMSGYFSPNCWLEPAPK